MLFPEKFLSNSETDSAACTGENNCSGCHVSFLAMKLLEDGGGADKEGM